MLPHSVRCLATGPRLLDIIKHECQTVLRGIVLRDFMQKMENLQNFQKFEKITVESIHIHSFNFRISLGFEFLVNL